MRTAVGFPCSKCGGAAPKGADIIDMAIDPEGNVALRLHCGRCEHVWYARKLAGGKWEIREDGLPE